GGGLHDPRVGAGHRHGGVYEVVRAAAARRSGAATALSVSLVVWVAATAAYYPRPRVCADILRLRGQQQARHGRHFDYPGATATADDDALLPQFVAPASRWQQDRGGGM
ncbi:unnamed protein product, partial [Urochloa humidicola]